MQRLYVCLPPGGRYVTVETWHALSLQFGKVRISVKSLFLFALDFFVYLCYVYFTE